MGALDDAHQESRKLLVSATQTSEAASRRAVEAALEANIDQLDGPDPRARAARVAGALGQALAGSVAQNRSASRRASDSSLDREFSAAGGNPNHLPDAVGGDDEQRGSAVGETFAAAWLAEFDSAYAPGIDVRELARRTLQAVEDERIPRISLTEAAHSFSAERSAVMDAFAKQCRAKGLPVPMKIWICVDGGDCITCFTLCGTTRAWDEPWLDGDDPPVEVVPGQVHPNCLCSMHVLSVPPVHGAPVSKGVSWPSDLSAKR